MITEHGYRTVHLACLLLHYVANRTTPNVQITTCLEEYPWYRSAMREMYRRCAVDATCTYTNGHITPFQEYRAIALCFRNIVTITSVAEMAPNATWDTSKSPSRSTVRQLPFETKLYKNKMTKFSKSYNTKHTRSNLQPRVSRNHYIISTADIKITRETKHALIKL